MAFPAPGHVHAGLACTVAADLPTTDPLGNGGGGGDTRDGLASGKWCIIGVLGFAGALVGCGSVLAQDVAVPSAAARIPEVVELTVADVESAYAKGEYTAVELTQAFLDRIKRHEPRYNAFISMNPAALAQAAELDAEYATSGPRGPLHGVPVVVKDNIDIAGLVTTVGFDGFSSGAGGVDMVPDDNAVVVDRLREAGAIILGKTNLPDFASHGTRTASSVAGVTLNPYDTTKVPGGSSGGTATAVNASFAVLGLGTETGGSIQNPAAAQGLVGVKPTFGLVPIEGVFPLSGYYVDVVGPLVRSVTDAAIALDVIVGPTHEDMASYASTGHVPEGGYAKALDAHSLEGRRFGLVGEGWRDDWLPLAPQTEAEYERAAATLTRLGATVVADPFDGSDFKGVYADRPRISTSAHDIAIYMGGLGEGAAFRTFAEWERLSGRELRRFSSGTPARPSATEAGDAFATWRAQALALFRQVLADHELDGLFFPQAGSPSRDLVEDPERPGYNPNNWPELPSNIINDIGLPTVTVPASHYSDGLPFVVAFIGDMWSEAELLSWAFAFEGATRARRSPELAPRSSGGAR